MTDALRPVTPTVNAYKGDGIAKTRDRLNQTLEKLRRLEVNPPKNVLLRLNGYRDACRVLSEHIETLQSINAGLSRELEQERGEVGRNSGRRWAPEDDEVLIEFVARGHNVQELASAFGRTPGAVASRVSHLVGIKRISYAVAAGISGYLDGQHVEGTFVGNVMPK